MTDQPDVTPIPKPTPKEKRPRGFLRRTRLKPVSDKRREEIPERERVREAVFRRDEHKCRIAPFLPDMPCTESLDTMTLVGEEMTVCHRHRQWVTENGQAARRLGLGLAP